MKKKYLFLIGIISLIVSFFIDKQMNIIFNYFRTPILDPIMILLDYLGTAFVIIIFLIILFSYYKEKKNLILLIISFAISLLVSNLLKYTILRQRPSLMMIKETSPSFPSNHATGAFSTITFLDKSFPLFKIFWIIFAFLITFSRLYLGVHYLSDVIAGILLGYFISLLVLYLDDKYNIINRYF